MIEVTLYTRKDCHLCEQALADLNELRELVPHNLTIIDVEGNSKLEKEYGLFVPVIEAGPYTLKPPIGRQDLEITLRALQHRQDQIDEINRAIESGEITFPIRWTKADRISYWISRHYLAFFNLFILIYVGLPFLAPSLMKAGLTTPASWIYRSYNLVCHQLAFRSWFLFGEQSYYPRQAAGIEDVLTYQEATGLDEDDILTARFYTGDERVGFKIALCERDVSIYIGILMFGLLFAVTGRKLRSVPWYIWIALGLVPIGVDGLSQLISQPPFSLIPYRESTPLLRMITGWLFGFMTAWFGYPMAEESMRASKEYMESKLRRVQRQQERDRVAQVDKEG